MYTVLKRTKIFNIPLCVAAVCRQRSCCIEEIEYCQNEKCTRRMDRRPVGATLVETPTDTELTVMTSPPPPTDSVGPTQGQTTNTFRPAGTDLRCPPTLCSQSQGHHPTPTVPTTTRTSQLQMLLPTPGTLIKSSKSELF